MLYSDPVLDTRVTDLQRDRAVDFLQQAYATGAVDADLFEDRLGQALTAETRADLNASLRGIARVAVTPDRAAAVPFARSQAPATLQNVAAGVAHASGLCSSVVGPALVKAISTPQSRLWLEASRALAWQSSMLIWLVAGVLSAVVLGFEAPLILGGLAWFFGTLVLAARALNGENSIARIQALMPVKPEPERRQLGI